MFAFLYTVNLLNFDPKAKVLTNYPPQSAIHFPNNTKAGFKWLHFKQQQLEFIKKVIYIEQHLYLWGLSEHKLTCFPVEEVYTFRKHK